MIEEILTKQRNFFATFKTLDVNFRIYALKKLQNAIIKRKEQIFDALQKDLGKHQLESYMCEVGLALSEISYLIKRVKRFAKPRKVKTPISQFSSKSYVLSCPYGNTLILSPWNYPFLLTIEPLANAISAGNTAVVKPSAYSPNVSLILQELIRETFDEEYVAIVTGGREENKTLLEKKFDLVFFTGSQAVGKIVLENTAKTLTPAILELGGKSPCIVDKSAKISLSAKRIVFGKFLNCGQTCVAPDYILCHKDVKEELLTHIVNEIKLQFGDNPLDNNEYGKIINIKHFNRLNELIGGLNPYYGGKSNEETLKIEPTVLDGVTWDSPVMQEEIFGPILPILTYKDESEIYELLADKEKPLALYVFAEDKGFIKNITTHIRYGGGCVNDTIIHLATPYLPFGGVGESGMGSYHGKFGFQAFSHKKAILDKKTWIDLSMRYHPYTAKKQKTIEKFLK